MATLSIKSVGIKRWVDSDVMRAMHNGHGFDRLLHLIAKPPDGLGWAPDGIAKEFNLRTEKTVYSWKIHLINEGYLTEEGYVNTAPRAN